MGLARGASEEFLTCYLWLALRGAFHYLPRELFESDAEVVTIWKMVSNRSECELCQLKLGLS